MLPPSWGEHSGAYRTNGHNKEGKRPPLHPFNVLNYKDKKKDPRKNFQGPLILGGGLEFRKGLLSGLIPYSIGHAVQFAEVAPQII